MDQALVDKIKRYCEATDAEVEEATRWIQQEEERLQRELTDEEIDNKHKEMKIKYNTRFEDF